MAFIYETYGPFFLERDGNKFRKEAFSKFWQEVAKTDKKLANAIGVYILAVQAKEKSTFKPWYVGKTDKQGFQARFKQQLTRFSDVLDFAKNGSPYVFLLARRTPTGRALMKPRSKALAVNDDLETMVIASCLKKNEQMVNAMKVRSVKEIVVPGYMNNSPGKMTKAAEQLNRMVKVKSK